MAHKMTPTPWYVRYMNKGEEEEESDFFIEAKKTNPKAGYNIEIMGSEDGQNYPYMQRKADAYSIVSAVNNTYGAQINPDAVKDILEALQAYVKDYEHEGGFSESEAIYHKAKAAIEKAKI